MQKNNSTDSRVLFDSQGELLRVWLNSEGQYKFPKSGANKTNDNNALVQHQSVKENELSEKYKIAVLAFEDKRFEKHFGIDVLAVARAVLQNMKAGKIVSGASTITMQVARLKNPRKRTVWAKLAETHTALRMELWETKDEIFAEYAALAPMGGNVVGAQTACFRFFGHSSRDMTWAEAALLALLPNKPSSLNLEKKRASLLERRNSLLKKLAKQGYIDVGDLSAALAENLPKINVNWRFKSPHYAEYMAGLHADENLIYGDLDSKIQEKLERLAGDYGSKIRERSNVNIAVLILETESKKIRGYLGSLGYYDSLSRGMIDGVRARRSTGSILKPFLYGLAIDRGAYTPDFLLEDVPTWFGSFSPQNADMSFSGIVPLRDALARSLNVPAVRVLADYGVDEFLYWLRYAGLSMPNTAEHYGLSLILGGGEASLLELAPLYAMLMNNGVKDSVQLLSPISAYHIREILTSVKRPEIEQYYAYFNNQTKVAWKTGTSYGSRDAWAIGTNSQWTIAVWIGNFEGGSVSGLSGAGSAAPLLFSLFNNLTDKSKNMWAIMPMHSDFEIVEICTLSGYEAREFCPHKKTIPLPANRKVRQLCEFHKEVVVSGNFEVCSKCWNVNDTLHKIEEHYTPAVRAELRKIGKEPPAEFLHNPLCSALKEDFPFAIIYPQNGAKLFLPKGDAQNTMGFIAQVAHKQASAELQWFLDGAFLGSTFGTNGNHKMSVNVPSGRHKIVVQNREGQVREIVFYIS
ncbi:penicillin-binding protein 1C [Fibrobacterales bacterium]|nr:penicillin-binding protein 1C [Fibrobacterales bacterium]